MHNLETIQRNNLKLSVTLKEQFAWLLGMISHFHSRTTIEPVVLITYPSMRTMRFFNIDLNRSKRQCIDSNRNIAYTSTHGWIPMAKNLDKSGTSGIIEFSAKPASNSFCVKRRLIDVFINSIVLSHPLFPNEVDGCNNPFCLRHILQWNCVWPPRFNPSRSSVSGMSATYEL